MPVFAHTLLGEGGEVPRREFASGITEGRTDMMSRQAGSMKINMYKDLTAVRDADWSEVLLIDDNEAWITPAQKGQWIAIAGYDPYLVTGEDGEFARIRRLLESGFPRPG